LNYNIVEHIWQLLYRVATCCHVILTCLSNRWITNPMSIGYPLQLSPFKYIE